MTYIGENFSVDTMKTEGEKSIDVSFDKLMKDSGLWEKFLSCSDSKIPKTTKRKIYDQLLNNTFHAQVGVVTDKHNKFFTEHYATKSSNQSFCGSTLPANTKKASPTVAIGAKRKLLAGEIQAKLILLVLLYHNSMYTM